MSDNGRMKPIIILPPDTVSKEDIQKLNDNGLCVIEAKDPMAVKFLDPIPSAAERTRVEAAAIQLSRRILNRDLIGSTGYMQYSDVTRAYIDLLVCGTSLDPNPTQQERESRIFTQEKESEIRKLAREEAKAERAKAKAKQIEAKK